MRRVMPALGRVLTVSVMGLAAMAAMPTAAAAQVDLVLNLSDAPDPVPAGGVISYAVTVGNDEVLTASGVEFSLDVPGDLKWQGYTGAGVSCSGMNVGDTGPGTVTCSLPDIAFLAVVPFSIDLKTIASGLVSIDAQVSALQADLIPGNNALNEQTTVTSGANVSLALTAPASAPSGSIVSFGMVVDNAGPDPASALEVQFPIPTGFSVTGGLPGGCNSAGGTITCSIPGPIAFPGSHNIGSVSGQLTVASGSTVSGVASVGLSATAPLGTPEDPDTSDNIDTAGISITQGSDLRLTKARSAPGPYFIGETFDFVLTASYTGDPPNTLTITDDIPANYSIGALVPNQNGWVCGVSIQTVTCQRPFGGAAGENQPLGSINIPVTVDASGAGIVNSATIGALLPMDPNPANNTGNDGGASLQDPVADLAILKSGPSPALAVVGIPFDFTLSVRNGGPFDFDGDLVMTDQVPVGLTVNSISENGWSCVPAAPIVGPSALTCSRTYTPASPLASGVTTPAVTLNTTATSVGLLTNTAVLTTVDPNVADPNPANNTVDRGVTADLPVDAADIRVLKTVDLATVPAGDILTYTLELVNDGPVASDSVRLVDNLVTLINNGIGATGAGFIDYAISLGNVAPGELTCASESSGSTSRRLTCEVATLPVCTAGSNCPTVDVRIRPGGNGGNRGNTGILTSYEIADPVLGNNSASISSTVLPRADVTVTKTGAPDPATAGQDLVYVVAASNNGPSEAQNVTITDLLPLDVIFLSAIASGGGSCSVTPGSGVVTTGPNRTLTCELNTIGNGSQKTVTIRVKPTNATRGSPITNNVSVATTTTEPDPPGNTNNTASEDVDVQNPDLDLVVNKDDDVDPLAVGDQTTYEIEVENIGPSDAENVVITDDLPASGLSFQGYTISNGVCGTVPAVDAVGGQLICTVARMAGGESSTITVDMLGVLKGVHTNTVTVASDETGLGFENAGNNVANENTTVRTKADLQVVSVTATPGTIAVRRPFTWTLHIRNNVGAALAEADDVEVTDNLPAGLVLTGNPTVNVTVGTASTTTCTGAAGDTGFTCDLGTVSDGGEVEITVPVRSLVVPAGGTRTNSASVTTFSLDVNPANNANSGVVTVEGSSLSGTVFRDFANTGTIDAGDTGISGIDMSLSGTAFDGSPVTGSATTDGSGSVTFDDLPDGTYTIQRGAVAETYLVTGQQVVGDRGGDASVVPEISGIALGQIDTGTGNLFAFIPRPRVGISKRALGLPILQADSSFVIELRMVVENFSLESMATVTIEDPLFGAPPRVGSFVPGGAGAALGLGTYTIQAAPAFVGACSGGSANAGFDGESDLEVATVAPFAVGASCEISFTLRFLPVVPLPPGGYANEATVDGIGALSGDTPSDISQNGTDPDPDGDSDPTNDDAPTPITPILIADVTTVLDFPAAVDAGELVLGTVLFRNDGPYQAEGVTYALTLEPDLEGVTVLNYPYTASWDYEPTTGVVTFTGLPTLLHAEETASLDGINGIRVRYKQAGTATSDITSAITTTTDQGANLLQDTDALTVPGGLIADITTSLSFPAFTPPGNLVRGTVSFRNSGPSIASDVTYSLLLDNGLAGVSLANLPAGASATYDAGTGVVTLTGMPATIDPDVLVSGDGVEPISLEYIQHASALTTVTSEMGTSTNQGRNLGPDRATATIVGTVTIGIAKAATLVGDTVTYEIKIENVGTAPVESLSVVDDLEAVFGLGNFIVVGMPTVLVAPSTGSVSLNASYTGTAGNSELIDQGSPATNILPVGESAVIQLRVQVLEVTDQGNGLGVFLNSSTLTVMGPVGTGPFTDTSVDGIEVDPDGNGDPSDDESPTPITLPVDATIGIAKQASVVGRRVTFDLTLVNSGNAAATGVSIQDDLDAVFGAGNYAVVTPPFFLEDPGTLALNGAFTGAGSEDQLLDPAMAMSNALARGDTASLRFEVDILQVTDQGGGLGVYENQAITSAMGPDGTTGPYVDWSTDGIDPDSDGDGDPTNNTAPTPFTLPMADLALEKIGPATALVGDTIRYTLTITNSGPGTALDIQIQDALPTGVSFISASDGGTHSAGVVTWPVVSELPENASEVRTVEVEISEVGVWENVGSVASSLDPDPANNDGSAPENKTTVTTEFALADVAVTKVGPTAASLGDTLTYVINTTNLGPDEARNVVVVDSLPSGVEFMEGSRGAVATGRHVEWPAVDLLAVDQVVVDTIVVSAPNAGIYTNVALATSDTGDPDSGNNDGSGENSRATTSVGTIDLALEKSITSELKTGETATWELVVRNLGTLPTTGPTTVVDQLPDGLTFVGSSGPGIVCSAQGQEVTCIYDEKLEPGSVRTFTLTTQVDAPAGVMLVNVASVSTPDEDFTANNNTASTEAMEVVGDGELVLEKSVASAAVEVGDLVRYELLLRNVGLGTARGVSINDGLPRGFFLVPGSVVLDGESVPDPVGAPGPELSFSLGDVAVGGPIRVSYTLRVGVGADRGEQVNVAQAQDETGEVSSNVATAVVEIRLGVFTDLGHILGRVWVEVSDSVEYDSRAQRDRFDPTLGVAGVRVYLQDGTSAVTDALGRYSFTDLRPRQWVVRVDERTLPPGMVLQRITSRHMGEGSSRFVDLTRGEMARADFGDMEADTLLYKRVQEWADMGTVPEIAVPSRLAMMGAGSMTRGPSGWRSQSGMNGRVSNLGQRPGVAPWNYGGGQAGGSSLLSRGSMAPLFSRPGSTSGMALDPDADRFGGSFVTGLKPEETGDGQGAAPSQGLRMLISGFIEGRFDVRSLTDGELFQGGARDRFQDALLEIASTTDNGKQILGGRAAAFATGEVGDGYQLTLRFDTEKDPTRRFFNDIRPDEMYDVFGDASSTLFEAQSKGRLFGALSKGGSYLMYGDYNTATYDAAQLLGRYSRTLNGVLHQYDSERVSFRAFASRDSFRQIVDELPAMGISGPYQLSKPDGLLNSERVEVIVRDRNQPALILDIVPMERFTDYTIEPFTGRLIFKRPVPSLDEGLNPVSIRVTYESETGGESFWVGGADARLAAGDHISLGAGFVRDDAPGNRYDLFSANAGITLGEGTWVNGEFAQSGSAGVQDGTAWRVEMRHASRRLDFRGFYLTADSTFQNTSAGVGVGRTEMGLTGGIKLAEGTSFLGEAIRSVDDGTEGTLTGGRVALLQRLGDHITGQVGYRYASQEGTVSGSGATQEEVRALGGRLEVGSAQSLTLFGEYEQDTSDSEARRLAVGGDVRVMERMRLYGRHELISTLQGPYTLNRGQDRNATVFGVSADYREGQSVFSEYRVGNGMSGRGAHAAIGLRNQWEVAEGVRLNTTFERVSPMDSASGGDVLAVTGGLDITSSPFWKGTMRAEYRATEAQDHVLGTVGFARRVSDEVTILAQSVGSKILDGGAFYERTRIGLAYRSGGSNGLNALARYEHRTDEDSLAPEGPRDHKAHILSAHVNLRPVDRFTLRGQWAAKYATDEVAGMTVEQAAQLVSGRVTLDLAKRLDIGGTGRAHRGEGRTQYGLGVDLGLTLGGGMRLGVGYNWFGFVDEDLSLDEYTDKGFYIDLGLRFDESLFGFGDDDRQRVGEARRH